MERSALPDQYLDVGIALVNLQQSVSFPPRSDLETAVFV
jgi:hypothetical protein